METIEVPGLGTGYLIDGKVVLAHEGGALTAMLQEEITSDTLLNGWRLATEAEAQTLAGMPAGSTSGAGESRAGESGAGDDPPINPPPEPYTDHQHKQDVMQLEDPETP